MPVVRARVWRALARRKRPVAESDIDDLVQEIWMRLVANSGKRILAYDPTRGMTLEGFVGMLAEHEIANHRERAEAKKRGADQRGEHDAIDELRSQDPSPEESVSVAELVARLAEHLERSLPVQGMLVLRH